MDVGHGANLSASSSRMFSNYELSDDLTRVHTQHLERKYGGRLRAHSAATKIQRAFRHYRLCQLYKEQVLGQPMTSSRIHSEVAHIPADYSSSRTNNVNANRAAHFRMLAKSQPSLKYQPVTSLRAQLQAERGQPNSSSTMTSSTMNFNHSPRAGDPLKSVSQRPYLELMSPRLSQRRSVIQTPTAHCRPPPSEIHIEQVSSSVAHVNFTLPLHPSQTESGTEALEPGSSPEHQVYYRPSSPVGLQDSATPSPAHQPRGSASSQPPNQMWLPRLSVHNNTITGANGHAINATGQPNSHLAIRHSSTPSIYHSNSLPRMHGKVHHHRGGATEPVANNRSAVGNSTRCCQPHQQSQMRKWSDQQRRRLYRIALNFFNKKPERGVQLLIGWGFVDENPRSVARLFLERRGLSKQMIGEFLGTLKSPFHNAVLEAFVNEIPMFEMEIDVALRQLLTYFRLPGEAQKIDHIMQAFSRRYRTCNPNRLPPNISPDTVYILSFAIIMLNTDLHSPSLKDSKRMKLDEFVKNIRGIEEGQKLDKQLLHGIYERVKEFEFRSGTDHVTQVMKVDQSIIGKDKPKLVEPHRRLICYCRLHQVQDPNRRQAANVHQREIFLFNDLMIIAKVFNKKRSNGGQYKLRHWSSLIGMRIEEFQNSFNNCGLVINCPDGQEFIFNAKNNDDRFRFIADVRESIAESTEMEQLRLEMELDKQSGQAVGGARNATVTENGVRVDAQRDSGLPDLDQQPSPTTMHCPQSFAVPVNGFIPSPTVSSNNGTPVRRFAGHIPNSAVPGIPKPSISSSSNGSPGSNQSTITSGVAESSGSATNGCTSTVNNTVARRLSFNSLDSGMGGGLPDTSSVVEETTD